MQRRIVFERNLFLLSISNSKAAAPPPLPPLFKRANYRRVKLKYIIPYSNTKQTLVNASMFGMLRKINAFFQTPHPFF